MRRSLRIPVWYGLPLLIVGAGAFYLGTGWPSSATTAPPLSVSALTATVTQRVTQVVTETATQVLINTVTQTVTQTVTLATPTESPKLALATTLDATATPLSTASPTPISVTDTPVPTTATSTTQPTATSAPPTATPKPTFTAAPSATATSVAVLNIGQTWQQNGMALTLTKAPYAQYGYTNYPTQMDFLAENKTAVVLNFDVGPNDYSVRFSDEKQFPGQSDTTFNNFAPGDKTTFSIQLKVSFSDFQGFERDTTNSYYLIVVTNFSSHIPKAVWRVDLAH